MKLTNEFTVAAGVDETWKTLLDLERVASCLPGATITAGDDEATYRGEMKVKIGAVTTQYVGVAEVREVDDDARLAVFDVKGKEARGQGTASATITNRVSPNGKGTKVIVETDLNVTGRPAQFGRGIMEDVATLMLGEFAKRLEREISNPVVADEPPHATTRTASESRTATPDDDVLDVGAVAWKPIARRAAPWAVAVAVVSAVLVARRRRPRRGITLTINL